MEPGDGAPVVTPSGSPPLGAPPAVAPQNPQRPNGSGPQVVTEQSLRQIKETAARRGAEEAIASLLGVSPEEARSTFARLKNGQPAPNYSPRPSNGNGNGGGPRHAQPNGGAPRQPTPPGEPPRPPAKGDSKAWARYERDRQQWQAKNQQYLTRIEKLAERERQARAERDALDAQMQLQRIAMQAGIKGEEIDYAVWRYQQKLAGMQDATQEQLAALDHFKFFAEELKKERPYLYHGGSPEVVRPANTGTGQESAAPPSPAAATGAAAGTELKHARDMKPDEYQSTLKKLGISASIPSR